VLQKYQMEQIELRQCNRKYWHQNVLSILWTKLPKKLAFEDRVNVHKYLRLRTTVPLNLNKSRFRYHLTDAHLNSALKVNATAQSLVPDITCL